MKNVPKVGEVWEMYAQLDDGWCYVLILSVCKKKGVAALVISDNIEERIRRHYQHGLNAFCESYHKLE